VAEMDATPARDEDAVSDIGKRCLGCKGTGVDPDQQHGRYTSGGTDEPVPCRDCGGEGENQRAPSPNA